ncbi:hypothetical protein BV22DRAFT_1135534 [Leucogyrophana mollusca]|uniref:Uncharacterized protein n=1 Tax=Leucogyrophana mollusca TaxID=85980 RepID=A0ACB8AWM5_9AGAM|nr:hypothetical protein BV22DRAFT_1135534 [Leucogyrophana mollusca]
MPRPPPPHVSPRALRTYPCPSPHSSRSPPSASTPLSWAVVQAQEPHRRRNLHTHHVDLFPTLLRDAAPLTPETMSILQPGPRQVSPPRTSAISTDALLAHTHATGAVRIRNARADGSFVTVIRIAWHMGVDFIASGRL